VPSLDIRPSEISRFGDGKVFELFSEYNDGLFGNEGVGRLVDIGVVGG
jgi:hypothetical protein